VAEGSESGGLLARSESGIAPACDKGGWGELRSLGTGLLVLWLINVVLSGTPDQHAWLRLVIPTIDTA
jgi:hypothetical protein